jgi:hypothetical protein
MSCGDPAIEEAPLYQPRFVRENHAAYKTLDIGNPARLRLELCLAVFIFMQGSAAHATTLARAA